MSLADTDVDAILEALEDHFQDRLTPWEFDFVADIGSQWTERRTLTDRQRAKLEDIWDRFRRGGG